MWFASTTQLVNQRMRYARIAGGLTLFLLCQAKSDAAIASEQVYVGTDHELVLVDPQMNTRIGSIPLTAVPSWAILWSLSVSPDGLLAYALSTANDVVIVDLRNQQIVAVIPVGEDYQLVVSPSGDRGYGAVATDNGIDLIQVIDLQQPAVLNMIVPGNPGDESEVENMSVSSDGRTLYALILDLGDEFQNYLVAIDTTTSTVKRLLVSSSQGLVLRNDHTAYIGGDGNVQVIDLDTLQVSGRIPLGSASADGLAISADGLLLGWEYLGTPDSPSSTVLTFNRSHRLTHQIPMSGNVAGLAVRADGRALYVGLAKNSDRLVVVDPLAGTIITSIALEAPPRAVVIGPEPNQSPGPVSSPSPASISAPGGGCGINPGSRSDPIWSLLPLVILAVIARRRRLREITPSPRATTHCIP